MVMQTRDNPTGAGSPGESDSVLRALFYVAIFAAVYVSLSISKTEVAFPIALLVFGALEVLRIFKKAKQSSALDVGCEVSFFLVLLVTFVGVCRGSFAVNRVFMFATLAYRPYFTMHCNRRLGFALCVLIAADALPIACGLVTDAGAVSIMSMLYALLVACLWVFCSKVSSRIF
jgi:hypothetical protein